MPLSGSLDLGIATVALIFEEELGNDMGRANSNRREIKLRSDLTGAALSATLLHEILHVWDDLVLNNGLQGNDDPHKFLDVLANLMDELLRRNWKVLEVLYAPTSGRRRKPKAARLQRQRSRSQRRA